ncbi:phosphatase PAP2 family protein [Brevundimonas subvibrioides]|uniref:Phosphoesterase PA-phosphatase related protein n=1 Tax=Brevundimonas subvibrioides (strain ATCC 15264 / DSM 4735 / LMG 14903 / NBRC 16000 / CB 81) TaxID=633149 RepID=D9QHQ3_BRESC|nr:phosphatase PAP2 family protein [Brevundimonas subvibrioides]ADK99328.1 phosphoesterase PA-phosphatase related protein [Brevundimonas subvibrioides ATCC 15264]
MAHITADDTRQRPRPRVSLHGIRREATRVRLSLAAGLRLGEPVTVAAVALLALSVYFVMLPGVDLAVTRLFYSPGSGFPLSGDVVLKALRQSSTYALMIIALGLLGEVAVGLRTKAVRFRHYSRRAVVLLAGLAIGPGLIVNGLLKSAWGRPRPVQVDLFGGEAAFTPAWTISDGCARNCSFVSGEASSAAWMVAAVWLMTPPEWRRWTVPAALTYGAALSVNRMAFGGHFLSDTLLSWAITGLVLAVLHRLMLACPVEARRARRALRQRARGLQAA